VTVAGVVLSTSFEFAVSFLIRTLVLNVKMLAIHAVVRAWLSNFTYPDFTW